MIDGGRFDAGEELVVADRDKEYFLSVPPREVISGSKLNAQKSEK